MITFLIVYYLKTSFFILVYYFLRLQIEHDKATSGYEELKSRTPQLERDLKKAEKEKFLAHDEIQNLNARLANVDSSRGQLAEENDVS